MNYKPVTAFSYDFLTPFYDSILNFLGFGEKQRIKIVDLMKLRRFERVLDVGCGTGSLLIVAKNKYPYLDMTGVDVDDKVLGIARDKIQKNNLNIKLVKSSADNLPFADNSFDVVVSSLVFHHLPVEVKKKALKEIHRVLKRSGRFLLVDFGKLGGWLKIIYYLEVLFRIPEAKTLKDNVDGKIPDYLRQTNFDFKEVAPRYRGIRYILAKKLSSN